MRFLEQNMSREPFVSTEEHANLASMRANIERQTIMQALIKNHNNKSQTAAELGISRNNLYKKIKKLHIDIDI